MALTVAFFYFFTEKFQSLRSFSVWLYRRKKGRRITIRKEIWRKNKGRKVKKKKEQKNKKNHYFAEWWAWRLEIEEGSYRAEVYKQKIPDVGPNVLKSVAGGFFH